MSNSLRGMVALLAAVPSAVSAQQKVPLVLHHLIVSVDSATYHDIIVSPFLRDQFSARQAGLLTGIDGGEGVRSFGKYNFLQLTPIAAGTRNVGVVLSSEHANGLAQLRRQGSFATRAEGARGPATGTAVTDYVEASSRIFPAGVDSLSAGVELEMLEYTAAAARELASRDSLSLENLSNSRFLARFFDRTRLLSHLTGATLAVPVDDIVKAVRVLRRDGVTVLDEGEGAIIRLDGFTLHLIPSFVGAGVKQLQFALTRTAVGNPIYRFGPKSQLRFGPGPIAVWDFTSQ